MTIKKKLIGYGYTDNNGVATLDYDENGTEISTLAPTGNSGYIGKGVGSVQLEAGLHGSEAVVSDPCTIFDCPVYDGDNTPTSISWSKTNNAIVTDEVVSLIASVLNTNNNPCINIPVVFKQGNTVLGTAYTDCNGDATITYTWADSDIFNVTAQVEQSLSEDITMFVKDKNNLWNHNVWSGTDYTHNTNDFTKNENLTSSTEWSYNGKRSLKLTRRTEEHNGYTTEHYTDLPKGDYLFTLKIYSPINTGGSITLFCSEGNVTAQYPKNEDTQTISISVTDKTVIGFRISLYSSLQSVWIDDIKITPQ